MIAKAVNQAVEALRKASKAEAAEEVAELFGETEELVSQLRELVDTGTANVAAMSKGRKARSLTYHRQPRLLSVRSIKPGRLLWQQSEVIAYLRSRY